MGGIVSAEFDSVVDAILRSSGAKKWPLWYQSEEEQLDNDDY